MLIVFELSAPNEPVAVNPKTVHHVWSSRETNDWTEIYFTQTKDFEIGFITVKGKFDEVVGALNTSLV
jgi:hypothetical protein